MANSMTRKRMTWPREQLANNGASFCLGHPWNTTKPRSAALNQERQETEIEGQLGLAKSVEFRKDEPFRSVRRDELTGLDTIGGSDCAPTDTSYDLTRIWRKFPCIIITAEPPLSPTSYCANESSALNSQNIPLTLKSGDSAAPRSLGLFTCARV